MVVSNGDLLHGRIPLKHQLNKQEKTGSRKFEPILTPQKDRQTLKKGWTPLTIHDVWYIHLHENHRNQPNVGS